jgi:hypothetical protein
MAKTPRTVVAGDPVEPKTAETKAERFTRLAKARMPNVIYRLRQIALLGGPTYEFTEDQAAKMVSTLLQEVRAIEVALKPKAKGEGSAKPSFDF